MDLFVCLNAQLHFTMREEFLYTWSHKNRNHYIASFPRMKSENIQH